MPSLLIGLLGALVGAGIVAFVRSRGSGPTAPLPPAPSDQDGRLIDVGRRLAEVAHELNNPLSAILAFAQDLLRADPSPEQREALLVIQQQARRSRKLVRGLLEEVRASVAGGPRIDPAALVARVTPVFEREATRHAIQFAASADPDLPTLEGDAAGMEQVLTNLLQNAFQATPRGGKVTLTTRARGRLLEFVVDDSGSGIPPEHLARIFDPFFTSKGPGEGTGLGLSVSQTIVRRHRGTLVAENIPPWEGGGARFVVSLPFVDRRQQDRESSDDESGESPPPQSPGRRILLIEDDEAVRLAMRRFLEREGWQVSEAVEGVGGLERSLVHDWDVIICDVRMPGVSGIEVHARVNQMDPARARRILLISGDAGHADVVEFKQRTGAEVLEKPFELKILAEAVERLARTIPPTAP